MSGTRRIPPMALPFDGALFLPGSKSESNRALILAALHPAETLIRGATASDDVCRMVEGLQTLGFRVQWRDRDAGLIEVQGGLPDHPEGTAATIDCGNAGTTLRFLASLAALVPGDWTLDGDRYMRERPIGDLVDAWKELGADVEAERGRPPLRIRGGTVRGGRTTLSAAKSSQFLSSLLLVGHALEAGLEITCRGPIASGGYVDLTFAVLERFGRRVVREGDVYRVAPRVDARDGGAIEYEVEGDWSAAGTFYALAEISGSRFLGLNLNPDSLQSDRRILDHLARMRERGDLVIDVSETPDQLMNLAVVAARRSDRTRFVGAANLRWKECDRLAVTAREFQKAGIRVEEQDDGLTVHGAAKVVAGHFDPENDHRMAMALAIFGSIVPGTHIVDWRCVNKSFPDFFDQLDRLRAQIRPIVFIGMRGCGKTTLGRFFADHFDLPFCDTDHEFEREHGPIKDYVESEGWPAFRLQESGYAARALHHPGVIALGGGAIESEETRDNLAKRGTAVWIDESPEILRERLSLAPGSRPVIDLGSPDIVSELETVLERRRGLYASTADLILPPGLSLEAQLAFLLEELKRPCSW